MMLMFSALALGHTTQSIVWIKKNTLFWMCLHFYQPEPCVSTVTCTILFIHKFMHPPREENKVFPEEVHTNKGISDVYSVPTLHPSLFFFTSPSPPGCVRPNLGGQRCIISRGLSSSAQLCVGCAPSMLRDAVEQTPLHHLSSAPHIQLEAEQASAKNLQLVISLWKKIIITFPKKALVSQRGIWLDIYRLWGFLFAHQICRHDWIHPRRKSSIQ